MSPDEARRIAVRAQLLDGSATDVLETVRTLGFLQLDPIATVAEPSISFSGTGSAGTTCGARPAPLGRAALFEWHAFVRPIEDLPLVRALMRRWRRSTRYSHERWVREFVASNAPFRRYVLRELGRRGPLLSRELEDRASGEPRGTGGTGRGRSA